MDLADRNKQVSEYINEGKGKALRFSREPTNEGRSNDEIRKIIVWQLSSNILFRQESSKGDKNKLRVCGGIGY